MIRPGDTLFNHVTGEELTFFETAALHGDPAGAGHDQARGAETVRYLRALIEELKAGGFVADALRRAHQLDTTVAPPG